MRPISVAKQQPSFIVTAIPQDISDKVRLTDLSPQYKHPASTAVATGYGPCRSCLKTFETGKDERILFTYNAFHDRAELPLPGPVFIHKEECERYNSEGFPPDLRSLPMLFEVFDDAGNMIERLTVVEDRIESQIEHLFAIDATKYIYIRNAEAGCFMAMIDRRKP